MYLLILLAGIVLRFGVGGWHLVGDILIGLSLALIVLEAWASERV